MVEGQKISGEMAAILDKAIREGFAEMVHQSKNMESGSHVNCWECSMPGRGNSKTKTWKGTAAWCVQAVRQCSWSGKGKGEKTNNKDPVLPGGEHEGCGF